MEFRSTLGELAARVRRDRIALAAAGVTYHWFLAVFRSCSRSSPRSPSPIVRFNDEVISSTHRARRAGGRRRLPYGPGDASARVGRPARLASLGIAIALAVVERVIRDGCAAARDGGRVGVGAATVVPSPCCRARARRRNPRPGRRGDRLRSRVRFPRRHPMARDGDPLEPRRGRDRGGARRDLDRAYPWVGGPSRS